MKTQRCAFTLNELIVVIAMIGLLIVLFAPSFLISKEQADKQKCANNLRKIGAGLIQYSNGHQYFPHMQALAAPNLVTDVAKVYRTLIYFKYIDDPRLFICPSSKDFPLPLVDATLKNPKRFEWKSPVPSRSNQAPILGPPDPDIFTDSDFHQLSYTYLRRKVASSAARSDTMIAADKAIKEEFDYGTAGNHIDGYNILYGDGHVDYSKTSEEGLRTLLYQRLHMGFFPPPNWWSTQSSAGD